MEDLSEKEVQAYKAEIEQMWAEIREHFQQVELIADKLAGYCDVAEAHRKAGFIPEPLSVVPATAWALHQALRALLARVALDHHEVERMERDNEKTEGEKPQAEDP